MDDFVQLAGVGALDGLGFAAIFEDDECGIPELDAVSIVSRSLPARTLNVRPDAVRLCNLLLVVAVDLGECNVVGARQLASQ